MKKKGFTLIELLAVIVILAVIALITVPAVMNVVTDAKNGAIKSSTYGYISALEKDISLRDATNGAPITPGTYSVGDFPNIVKGTKPTSGIIVVGESLEIEEAQICIYDVRVNYSNQVATIDPNNDCSTIVYVPEPTDEACFDFDPDTGTINSYLRDDVLCTADVSIPSTIGGVSVAALGTYSFAQNLSSVYIPNTVTTIGDFAIVGGNYTSLIIPNSVVNIGRYAFGWGQLAGTITIPINVKNIGEQAFAGNQITNVVFNDGLETIGMQAFQQNLLTSIELPDSVVNIGRYAFSDNPLTDIDIPNGYIDEYAFSEGYLDEEYLGIETFNLGRNVTIGDRALYQARFNIQTNHLVIDVEEIGTGQYINLNIDTLTINANSIGNWMISSYSNQSNINHLIIGSRVQSIADGAFCEAGIETLTLNNGLTTIGSDAFLGNNLTTLVLPNTITSIERAAFVDNNLTSITIGSGVTLDDAVFGPPYFYDAYILDGAGTYTGTQDGDWTKQ